MAEGTIRSEAGHSHSFRVKLHPKDLQEYSITCVQPCTVLEAIKSLHNYRKTIKCADQNIIIEFGQTDKEFAIATHFPCTCISENELLFLSCNKKEVEKVIKTPDQKYSVYPRDKYSVFYIDCDGGHRTETICIFKNTALRKFKYACVYGEKGETVEEVLKRDGRFIDDLRDFTLTEDRNHIVENKQSVKKLHQKKFKLCRGSKVNTEEHLVTSGASNSVGTTKQCDTATVAVDTTQTLDVTLPSGTCLKTEKRDSGVNTSEISIILRLQAAALKEWMKSRFPGKSYQGQLKQVNFGKIQASFSEVHRVRKLLKLGESVCRLEVNSSKSFCGTGFVLFDNIVLTNGHLFTLCDFPGDIWMKNLEETVTAVFNCEDWNAPQNWTRVKVTRILDLIHLKLDYAILELERDAMPQSKPPGLLKLFVELPLSGEACIIGHPNGGVKQMDPTCIIEKQSREQHVKDYLHPFIAHKVINSLKARGIEKIMMGGSDSDNLVTYPTFMFHGSSGSPVFDGAGNVFGLHTAGFEYELLRCKDSVIEYAQPLLAVFKNFVDRLKEKGNVELLNRVVEEAMGNLNLEMVCGLKPDDDEPMQMG